MENYWEIGVNEMVPLDETLSYSWICMGLKIAIVEHLIWILENSWMITEVVR